MKSFTGGLSESMYMSTIKTREAQTFNYLSMQGAYMHKEERRLINYLSTCAAKKFDPCVIVHIGVAWGASLYCSRAGAPHATIYGVDIFGGENLRGADEQKAELDIQVIREDSRTAWQKFNKPIHLLYVDGDHSYETVSSDIENWGKKVVPGGFAAFHDCIDCEVAEAISRALDDHMNPEEWEYLGIEAWSKYYAKI